MVCCGYFPDQPEIITTANRAILIDHVDVDSVRVLITN